MFYIISKFISWLSILIDIVLYILFSLKDNSKKYLIVNILKRSLSYNNKKDNFFLWLAGLSDGEANFYIGKNGNSFYFHYKITLHIDDKDM